MNKIQSILAALGGGKALISYITASDPNKETTPGLTHNLAANGADTIELGVPFSDPVADGPTIQRAAERTLAKGVSLSNVLDIVRTSRRTDWTTPVTLMSYFNPVHKMGYARSTETAAEASIDNVLTVDAPVENIDGLHGELKSHGIGCTSPVAPTATKECIRSIAAVANGFVYHVSFKGVTDAINLDTDEVSRKVELLRKYVSLPIGVGFGINSTESARRIGKIADAVTVGSRIVKEIENNAGYETKAVDTLIRELKDAVKAV